jgi:hypothetical protein
MNNETNNNDASAAADKTAPRERLPHMLTVECASIFRAKEREQSVSAAADKTAQTGGGIAPRITFESASGQTLQKRFNQLARYYRNTAQPAQWIAEEFKKSLISNIQRGTIVVEVNGERGLA